MINPLYVAATIWENISLTLIFSEKLFLVSLGVS